MLAAVAASAQTATTAPEPDLPKSVIAQIGVGGSFSTTSEAMLPTDASESRLGPSLTARVLWRPGHLLGIGIESGLTRISTLETTDGARLSLTTVPAMLVFAMENDGFDASVAVGWQRYIVSTPDRTISSAWEMSYIVAAGYTWALDPAFGIGAEASFGTLPERETSYVSLQLRGEYRLVY